HQIMNLIQLKPRKALNKAFLKVKANRIEIELFKTNLIRLIDHINESESEEFHKNLVSDFLKNTYYGEHHYINTKGRNDLVIHNGNKSSDTVAVIIEAKKPGNKAEMLKTDNLNTKAFQELVLYYLRERITHKNLEIKHLIACNIFEWFIFDASLFEKEFAQNKNLIKQFIDFEEGRLSGKTTDFFYTQIAQPAIEAIKDEIVFTHFDIRDYDKPLRNEDKKDDNLLIALYKLLSPEHLLKLPFANDSNSLDKTFYAELLHIIGLTETKDGGKKLIQRKKEGERNSGSLIESAIFQLENLDKITRLNKPSQFGDNYQERLFNVALELVITWVNRILFLKLLEAQLLKYNKGDKSFSFLTIDRIKDFDELNNLFFSVLARKPQERNEKVKHLFSNVPYLNSSLFEATDIEHACLFISQLSNENLPLLSSTVIKNNTGQKLTGNLVTIQYIFEFLNAYDFASEGSEEIQEDNKRLINASVLGLIFEKINGYKDGSFFTPGFITMYMCRETIRRAVVQKFNEAGANLSGFRNLTGLKDVYDIIGTHFTRTEANTVINSLKICDPAVGSGHFLVSALNEIIAVKSELRILEDREGSRLKEYNIVVENDELVVSDEDGKLFEYNPKSKESQRVQECLFHEKQTIIENCLFGVDINPNSVKICRLRLWIELLKNAYYILRTDNNLPIPELETLPNIDINIKCGNSLISRYALDADVKKLLKSSKWSINSYRIAVASYRNAKSKEEKRDLEALILKIKQDFTSEIRYNDPLITRRDKLVNELYNRFTGNFLFEPEEFYGKKDKDIEKKREKEKAKLEGEINTISQKIEEIKDNKIYENSFEWRFEFPEVLNDNGDFIGFDVVIGNPPYGAIIDKFSKPYFSSNYLTLQGPFEIYKFFYEKAFSISKLLGFICFITPDTWTNLSYFKKLRLFLFGNYNLELCTKTLYDVFEEATVDNIISLFIKSNANSSTFNIIDNNLSDISIGIIEKKEDDFQIILKPKPNIIYKIEKDNSILNNYIDVWRGMSAYGAANPDKPYNSNSKDTEHHRPLLNGGDIGKYTIKWNGEYIKYGSWLHRARPNHIYDRPHLLVQRIRNPRLINRIIATFDDEKYISSDGLSILILKDETLTIDFLKYILSIINSKLINYWFSFYFFDVNIKPEQLRLIPIKLANDFNPFVEQVDKILILKKNDSLIDTTSIEAEIDQLVYQLYGLSEEEIKIVEGNN
ncbi:MAG: DUF7149 domain-containing protein, partial [Bacteroidales bacterium]